MTRRAAVILAALALLLAAATSAQPASAAVAIPPSPLASNGFESPSCSSPELNAQLAPGEQQNCAVSGVAVAADPLSNYAVDVDVSAGLGASIPDNLLSIVQGLLLTPVWTALVWLVHVVLIALEWCYSLELLGPATLARASASLGAAQRVFTDPWLGLALAIAAIGFAWQGLVRRRVLDTLGRAALLGVMVLAGLWIIADPSGTVGAVGGLADQAALATVAASATGDPSEPVASVDGAFGGVFDAVVDGPWCYLEFGDVDWCRDADALDPRLAAVGAKLESIYRAAATCTGNPPGLVRCAPGGSALQAQLQATATALAAARTNGALFLAVPPTDAARAALATPSGTPTLYGTLCGSSDATGCTAPTAPQAEFRTAAGTWPRVGGLVLIVAGTLGMLLLFGFLALRLLGAALATLLYLLLAPVAVLAPALGDSGRDTFRLWLTRLCGSLLAKLVYSVALGVVLLVVALLESLDGLGWWTPWLLVSVFWWTAFEHRHRVLSLVLHERGEPARRSPLATRAWLVGRTASAGLGAPATAVRRTFRAAGAGAEAVSWLRDHSRVGQPTTAPERLVAAASRAETRGRARADLRGQAERVMAVERSGRLPRDAPPATALRERAARLEAGLADARSTGDRRRVVSLERRAAAVAGGLATERPAPRSSSSILPRGLAVRAQARRLNRAARTPPATVARSDQRAAPLAPLAGMTANEFRRLGDVERRAARLEIARALERRRDLLDRARPATSRVVRAAAERLREQGPRGIAAAERARRRRQFGSESR